MLSFLYVYSDHSILECYNLISGVELSMRSFFVISFDKDIPDADSKKIVQHHFKLKKKHVWGIHELCVENVRKRGIQCRHDKSDACSNLTNCIMFVLF